MVADNLANLPMIDTRILDNCLGKIWQCYRSFNVTYHNDMHSLDVSQMTYILLKTGPDCMADILELTPIEQFAILIAGVCHDFGHDGFNNGYHVAM